MHADVAGHAFELLRQLDQVLDIFLLLDALRQHRLRLDRIGVLVALLLGVGRVLQGDMQARLVRDQLGDAVTEGVAHVHGPAHVADHRPCGHGAEGRDLADRIAAVAVLHVVDHPVAVGLAEVHVEVGHGNPFGVQETFKQQVVVDGIQVRDLQHIGHQRPRPRATTRAHRAAIVLGPVDEVSHDQEVAGKAHLQNDAQLKLQTLHVLRTLGVARCGIAEQQHQALFQPLEGGTAEVVRD